MTINILPVPKADYGLNPAVVGPGYSKKGDFTPEILKKMGFTPYSTVK
jgi:hypothetical protein